MSLLSVLLYKCKANHTTDTFYSYNVRDNFCLKLAKYKIFDSSVSTVTGHWLSNWKPNPKRGWIVLFRHYVQTCMDINHTQAEGTPRELATATQPQFPRIVISLSWTHVSEWSNAVSSICAAPVSKMCSTQADNISHGVRLSPLVTAAITGLLYQLQMTVDGDCGSVGGMWQGNPKYSEKTCPSATLSTANPTWLNLGSKPGLCGKSATNHLSCGTGISVWRKLRHSLWSLLKI
jgi:hypothetical protein